jgi:hypothetical protein
MDHPHAFTPQADPRRLHEDIAYIQARLAEIGHDGDCAYEKAMIRFFEQQLAARRAWLQAS